MGRTNKCSICGLIVVKNIDARSTQGISRSKSILLQWKKECSKSLCDILFNSYIGPPSSFLEYFQNGEYCSKCLQIVREINFTWRQLKAFQFQVDSLVKQICKLIHGHYLGVINKCDGNPKKKKIRTLEGFSNPCSRNEIFEMIHKASAKYSRLISGPNETEKKEVALSDLGDIKDEMLGCDYQLKCDGTDVKTSEHFTNSNRVGEISSFDPLSHSNALKSNDLTQHEVKLEDDRYCSKSVIGNVWPSNALKCQDSSSDNFSLDDPLETESCIKNETDNLESQNAKSRRIFSNLYHPKVLDTNSSTRETRLLERQARQLNKIKLIKSSKRDVCLKSARKVKNKRKSTSLKAQSTSDIEKSNRIKIPKIKSKNNTKILLTDVEMTYLKKNAESRPRSAHFQNPTDVEIELFDKIFHTSLESLVLELRIPEVVRDYLVYIKRRMRGRRPWLKKGGIVSYPSFVCLEKDCNEYFTIEEELQGHIRGHHQNEQLPYYCTTCPMNLKTYKLMIRHRTARHKGVKLSYYHFCNVCEKGYATEDELVAHNSQAHHLPHPFKCSICDEICTCSTQLIQHMRECHAEAPFRKTSSPNYKCNECGERYNDRKSLRDHLEQLHKAALPPDLKCIFCRKTFDSSEELRIHKKTHAGFMCDICGNVFVSLYLLKNHSVVHTGERKFYCVICNKTFKRSSQLRDHERVHTGIRTYLCKVCGKGFMTSTVLNGHEKTHEPGYIPRKPFRRKKPRKIKLTPLENSDAS